MGGKVKLLSNVFCSVCTCKEWPESWAMKVEWWILRFCRFATSLTVPSWGELGILCWCCMWSCATGCSTSWHHRGHRHFPRRAPSNIWTCRGPYCSGGDWWQKLAQAGKEASTSGACTTLQPPGQAGKAGRQTVQPKRPEPLHACRLETHSSHLILFSLKPFTHFTPGENHDVCLLSLGWTAERVQEYFLWACEVVKGLRGTNSVLEEKLDELFKQRGVQPWLQDRTWKTNVHPLCKLYK